jgi:hypothetical protein
LVLVHNLLLAMLSRLETKVGTQYSMELLLLAVAMEDVDLVVQ